jgi:hypothetical protein
MSTQEQPESKTQDQDDNPIPPPPPPPPPPANPVTADPEVESKYDRPNKVFMFYTTGMVGKREGLRYTYKTNTKLVSVIGMKNKIPVEFFNKYFKVLIGEARVKALSNRRLVLLSSRISAIILLEKEKNRYNWLTEMLFYFYEETRRRKENRELIPLNSPDYPDIIHASEVVESAFNKNAELPEPDATHKTTVQTGTAQERKARRDKIDGALRSAGVLGPDKDNKFYDIDTFEDFLKVATPEQIKKEKDEIDEALELLKEAQEDKFLKADDINQQRKKLQDLLNRLNNPERYADGATPDYSTGQTFRAQPAGGMGAPPEGIYQTNTGGADRQTDTGNIARPNPIGTTYSVRNAPPARTGPEVVPETVQAQAPAPEPIQAQPTIQGATGNRQIELEAREYIRKIGEIPISILPANVNELRKQLDVALNKQIPTTGTQQQIQKAKEDRQRELLIAVTKARSYFSRILRKSKNFLPDSMETAGRVIDDALEDTKKIEEQRKAEQAKKIPLDDMRPDVEQGEERRINKSFNRDVLKLSEANEVLESKVELQREEIKQLKETIQTKEQKENDAMLSGIAPVFRNLLYLDLDNVVKEEEAQEQVYYTVI